MIPAAAPADTVESGLDFLLGRLVRRFPETAAAKPLLYSLVPPAEDGPLLQIILCGSALRLLGCFAGTESAVNAGELGGSELWELGWGSKNGDRVHFCKHEEKKTLLFLRCVFLFSALTSGTMKYR